MKFLNLLHSIKSQASFLVLQAYGRKAGLDLHRSQIRPFAWQMVRGTYEKEIIEEMLKCLPVGGVFLDIGANIGYVTVMAARRCGAGGRVYSFEPNPVLFPTLLKNAKRHSCVTAFNKAAGRTAGELPFYIGDTTDSGSFARDFVKLCTYHKLTETVVSICPAEVILEEMEVTHVDVVKLDVEGFEHEALAGLGAFLNPARMGYLFIEINPRAQRASGHSTGGLLAFVAEKGYRIFGIESPWKDKEILAEDYRQFEEDIGDGYTTIQCRGN